jgi:hypothetical protein
VRRALTLSVLAGAICAAWPVFAQAPADSATIQEAAERVLAREEYDLERAERRFRLNLGWFFRPIGDVLRGIFDFFGGMPPILAWLLVGAVVAFLIWMLWRMGQAYAEARRIPKSAAVAFTEEKVSTLKELLQQVQAFAAQENYVDASRTLYRAALVMLEDKRGGRVMNGLTTTEYLDTFRTDWIRDNLRVFADLINWKWYRARSFDANDFAQCQSAFDVLQERLRKEF